MDMNKTSYAKAIAEHFTGAEIREVTKAKEHLIGIAIPFDVYGSDRIRPNFYIDGYFDMGLSVEEAVKAIRNAMSEGDFIGQSDYVSKIADFDNSWDSIKTKIIPVLMNRDYREPSALISDISGAIDSPDIVMGYRILLSEDERGRASIQVTVGMLDEWGVTEEDVMYMAMESLVNEKPKIEALDNVLEMLMGIPMNNPIGQQLLVITNQNGVDGAVMVLHPDVKEYKDLYTFIPSSRHEILGIPKGLSSQDEINKMVHEVNRDVVAERDFLSDYSFNLI